MEAYHLIQFRCPFCGQRLAVLRDQVLRGETVVCQDCNTDVALVARGARPRGASAPDGTRMTVELKV
ncbi:hypothetical protein DCC79_14180 [bacterium]|nr:MAG: hypothetical protein DCC79_14180 [bacterium]